MKISREQLAWAGGFFEGEGGVQSSSQSSKDQSYVRAYIGQCNVDALIRFKESVFGLGKIYGPLPVQRPHHTPHYRWVVSGYESTQAVMAALWPFLTNKVRKKFTDALTTYVSSRGSRRTRYQPPRRYI